MTTLKKLTELTRAEQIFVMDLDETQDGRLLPLDFLEILASVLFLTWILLSSLTWILWTTTIYDEYIYWIIP